MDFRDGVLQKMTPAVMVPKFSHFDPLETNGHRFLVAGNGLWIEARRAWLHIVTQLSGDAGVAMPYGNLEEQIEFTFGRLPTPLIREFIGYAEKRRPSECAAWIVWDEQDGSFALEHLQETSVSGAHVTFNRPSLQDGRHLVIDLHSHGEHHAFFSSMDNDDDAGELKVAGVVGFSGDKLTVQFRLCAMGKFIPLNVESSQFTMPVGEGEAV